MTSVLVSPPAALRERSRLFGALGHALDVTFVDTDASDVVATVSIGSETDASPQRPMIVLGSGAGPPAHATTVSFTDAPILDRPLHRATIPDRSIGGQASLVPGGEASVLARCGEHPVWTTSEVSAGRLDHAAAAPDELGDEATLRDRMASGSFIDLLPLVSFLRSVASPVQLPPVRAAFIMDDPNLHGVTYGHLDYRRVIRESADTGYHLTIAAIPLDFGYTNRRTADLFRDHPDALSIMVHGNNHTRFEMGYPDGDERGRALVAEAMRRTARFESSTGLPVARVMAVPHGRCAEQAALDMARLGFESLTVSRPLPWLDTPPPGAPLAGWFPADTHAALPAIPRVPLSSDGDDLPIRAFLGQPIIPYGHEDDLIDEPDLLVRWAERIAALGDVIWSPVSEISRSLASTKTAGHRLSVTPHTRVVEIDLDGSCRRLEIEADAPHWVSVSTVFDTGNRVTSALDDNGRAELENPRGSTQALITMHVEGATDPLATAAPTFAAWPIARRILTEGRDRVRATPVGAALLQPRSVVNGR